MSPEGDAIIFHSCQSIETVMLLWISVAYITHSEEIVKETTQTKRLATGRTNLRKETRKKNFYIPVVQNSWQMTLAENHHAA